MISKRSRLEALDKQKTKVRPQGNLQIIVVQWREEIGGNIRMKKVAVLKGRAQLDGDRISVEIGHTQSTIEWKHCHWHRNEQKYLCNSPSEMFSGMPSTFLVIIRVSPNTANSRLGEITKNEQRNNLIH